MRARRLSDERGIALAVAVFALVVIGALVAGTFFAGRLEQQTGSNTFMAAQAAEAAEAGLSDAIAGQTAATLLAVKTDLVDSTEVLGALTVG
jgi:Tfp pilus assembly protein PilX